MKVGILVNCVRCGRMKTPMGRSAPAELVHCNQDECSGYMEAPFPGVLWPGETEEEYGYHPVPSSGCREEE